MLLHIRLLLYLFHNIQLEWHCIALLCWCAVKKLLTHSLRNHSAAICNRMSTTLKIINRGCVTLGQNLGMFPLEQTRHVGVAQSERPRLTNGKIIFEEFQPMWSQFTNVTDRQTDRQTTCDRNTALCTKVHRAVKTDNSLCSYSI